MSDTIPKPLTAADVEQMLERARKVEGLTNDEWPMSEVQDIATELEALAADWRRLRASRPEWVQLRSEHAALHKQLADAVAALEHIAGGNVSPSIDYARAALARLRGKDATIAVVPALPIDPAADVLVDGLLKKARGKDGV